MVSVQVQTAERIVSKRPMRNGYYWVHALINEIMKVKNIARQKTVTKWLENGDRDESGMSSP